MKNVAMLRKDGAFAAFFRPEAKKMVMPGGQSGGGGVGAGGIDWCINCICKTHKQNGVSQQLRTLAFRKIKFRDEELISSRENLDFRARQIADTNNVNLVEWIIYRISVGSLKL